MTYRSGFTDEQQRTLRDLETRLREQERTKRIPRRGEVENGRTHRAKAGETVYLAAGATSTVVLPKASRLNVDKEIKVVPSARGGSFTASVIDPSNETSANVTAAATYKSDGKRWELV